MPMSRHDILLNLKRLGKKLAERNLKGELILTEDTSMCLVHSARDMTKDVDAIYEPKLVINEIVREIAEENDLPHAWLNDSVKGFVTDSIQTVGFAQFGSLKVSTVSAEYLLAMKLISARVTGQDYNDILFLIRKLGLFSMDAIQKILAKYYPASMILPKTQYVIEQILAELKAEE